MTSINYIKRQIRSCLPECILAALRGSALWGYTFVIVLFKSVIIAGIVNQTDYLQNPFWQVCGVIPTYMVYYAFFFLTLSFAFLLTGKKRIWFLLGFNVVYSVLLLFDLWYFRAFGTFLSVYVFKQFYNLENLSGSIMSLVNIEDLIFVFDIPGLLFLAFGRKNLYSQAKRSAPVFLLLTLVAATYLAYAHYEFDLSADRGKKQYLFEMCWAPTQTITELSPIGFHLFDVVNYLTECRQLELTPAEIDEIKSWYAEKQENLPDNEYKGLFKGKNLLFIQVESLERFYLKNKLDGQEITPNLNRLLKNSLYFSNIYEQVNVGTTADAELMANTSVLPLRVGTTYLRFPDNYYQSMPKLMTALGYSTIAIHPDNRAYYDWMNNMEAIGYSMCVDSMFFQLDEFINMGLSDGCFFRQAEPYIVKQQRPFFAFLVTLTNHTPFVLPDKYKELTMDKKFDGTMLANSFHTAHYTDKQIGELLDRLDKQGILDNTVVVLYGDHCGVHKFYPEDVKNITPPDDWWLDNDRHVPLMIYQKNMAGKEITVTGGQIDMLPTVAYLMGVDEKEYSQAAMGRNLLKTNKDFAVLVNGKVVGQATQEEAAHAVRSLEIADKIIRSSYFGKREY